MPRLDPRALLLVGVVLIAGCGGVILSHDRPDAEEQRLRLVVKNDASSAQAIDLTLSGADGRTMLEETKTLQPGGGWVVTTVNVSSADTPVTVTARLPGRNYTAELTPIRGADRGSRLHLIEEEGIGIHECNVNLTCWKQRPEAL